MTVGTLVRLDAVQGVPMVEPMWVRIEAVRDDMWITKIEVIGSSPRHRVGQESRIVADPRHSAFARTVFDHDPDEYLVALARQALLGRTNE